ncbi:unnamed protein product [Rotaria sp. Silwood2]|nr:unnamed protein product [Rotaria sp. Silwood2]
MTTTPSETPPYNYCNISANVSQYEINNTEVMKQRPSLLHRITDLFKRVHPSENISIEMNGSTQGDDQNDDVEKEGNGLHRKLSNRHLQMIAIGGTIGTGLFVGSGSALASGGPAALTLDFLIIGFVLFNVCMALGELAVIFPVS